MWTYDLTHRHVDLKMAIALATMTFKKGTNLYELHPMKERVFHDFIKQEHFFWYKYWRPISFASLSFLYTHGIVLNLFILSHLMHTFFSYG
jgi:hypothetical protein